MMIGLVTTLEVQFVNRWGSVVCIAGKMATFGHLDKADTQ